MSNIKIHVNHIITPNKHRGVYGIANKEKEIQWCLQNTFTEEDAKKFKDIAGKDIKKGASVFNNFYQFIIYAKLDGNLMTGSIAYFDCFNNVDNALDIYSQFTRGDWSADYKSEFMNQFLLIQAKYDEVDKAELLEV